MQLNSFQIRFYKFLYYNRVKYLYVPLAIYWVILFTATTVPTDSLPSFGINDKFEHFGAYFVLSVLFSLTLFLQEKNENLKKHFNLYTVSILLFYGIFDEVHQFFIPGRYFDWLDLLSNLIGIVFGVYLVRKFFVLPLKSVIKTFDK
jgi:VanZ family protein